MFSPGTVLITGATSGIGLHLAHVCAKHRHPLILVAPVAGLVERVGILCNNAGHGFRERYHDLPVENHLSMIALNVEAVVRLASLFLPAFVARGAGRIPNTASIAGFEPGPLMATYHASKAFVLSLSESLATENESTGVTITALCPGPVDTDFCEEAEMNQKLHEDVPAGDHRRDHGAKEKPAAAKHHH